MTPTQLLGACILIVLFVVVMYVMIYAYGWKETLLGLGSALAFVAILALGILLVWGKFPI